MGARMDRWISDWMDEFVYRWVDGWIGEQVSGLIHVDGWMDG